MTAIWRNDGPGWRLLAPSGFPDEAALHSLVEEAPHILPLAGAPHLIVVGREVLLGNGYADLIAIEPSGRLAVIEVKLARNAEARRAVVAQVLTYAAYLKGLETDTFEREVLGRHLQARGYQDLAQAVSANDQEGSFDIAGFTSGLSDSLSRGLFRLVFVLDAAPPELIRLIGYLESITAGLVIDLITVSSYDVNGSQLLVPQSVALEPRPLQAPAITNLSSAKPMGRSAEGADDFIAAIEQSSPDHRASLRRLADWALSLEQQGLAHLSTYRGKDGVLNLLPRVPSEGAGLVTIYNTKGGYMQFWRSVFERRAPAALPHLEEIVAPIRVGQGNWTPNVTDRLLEVLLDAYREAATNSIAR